MAYGNTIKLTKETILDKVSESLIFQYYLGYLPEEGRYYTNPLRTDRNPTCYFYSVTESSGRTKLKFRDPASNLNEDCFGIVMKVNGCNYPQALETIAKDFGLYGWSRNKIQQIDNSKEEQKIINKEKAKYRVKFRKWNLIDAEYWKQYYITSEVLNLYGVRPVHAFWINNSELPYYIYTDKDPCYAYVFPNKTVKLYLPYRGKGYKFKNGSTYLQGLQVLPSTGENLIITKSYKDVIAMYMFGINSVAPQQEGKKIEEDIILDLKRRFNNIYTLYDWDRTGIKSAIKLRDEYGFKPIFFTKKDSCNFLGSKVKINFEYKDFTDNLKAYGVYDMIDIIRYFNTSIEVNNLLKQNIIPF